MPVKTLRYYAEIGLLNPQSVNEENNYRYYGAAQLVALNRILALKDAGFSLDEIMQLDKRQPSKDELLTLLESKLHIARNTQMLAEMRITNLQARIKHIQLEEEYKMAEVTVKRIEPLLVASIRKQNATWEEFGGLYDIILNDMKPHGVKEAGPIIKLGYTDERSAEGAPLDMEACVPIDKVYTSSHPDIAVYCLPAVEKMACVVYKGAWGELGDVVGNMLEWVKLNGLEHSFPYREIYHHGEREEPDAACPQSGIETPEAWANYVTEIQYPIKD